MAIVVNKPIPEFEANATGGIKVTNTSHNGQILVLYDVLDITSGRKPRFVKNFMEGASSNLDAMRRYVQAVKQRSYPGPEHEFHA